jgi:hypothetical protein
VLEAVLDRNQDAVSFAYPQAGKATPGCGHLLDHPGVAQAPCAVDHRVAIRAPQGGFFK